MFRIACCGLAAAFAMLAPEPAAAQRWLKATTPNFVVYSDAPEPYLREYVQNLETFDKVIRLMLTMPLDPAKQRLPIYLVRGKAELEVVRPELPENVAGFYSASSEGPFAMAIRQGEDDVLLHEYAHHILIGQGNGGQYPAWLNEGLAEYFMTTSFHAAGRVDVGAANENRASWVAEGSWLPLSDLFSKRPGEIRDEEHRATYYPVAWLVTHYFLSTPERKAQLNRYLSLLGQGGESGSAMETATGMTLDGLTRALRTYSRSARQGVRFTNLTPNLEIAIERLPASADALLLKGLRLKGGYTEEEEPALLADIEAQAARFPDDPLALFTLGHAGLHAGDRPGGLTALRRLIALHPEHVEGLQFLAMGLMEQARDDATPEGARPELVREARSLLGRAYRAAPGEFMTLHLLAQTRQGAPDYPTENDLTTWDQALQLAPQIGGIRLGYAQALIRAQEPDEAIAVLTPLANAPHGGPGAAAAKQMIERARTGGGPASSANETPPAETD